MAYKILSAALLRQLLSYEPKTGVFTWKVARSNRVIVGGIAGTLRANGYVGFSINKRAYLAHRLAWLHHYGELAPEWPTCQIDHINRIKHDNRIENLRLVSSSVNKQNRTTAHSNNQLGLLGVNRNGNYYKARIVIDGAEKHIGTFKTPEAAHDAYLRAKAQIHSGGVLSPAAGERFTKS